MSSTHREQGPPSGAVLRVFAAAAAAAATFALGLAPATHAARTASVSLKDISFKPATVTIHRGDSVRWTWRDARTLHNVTSQGSPRFRSSSEYKAGHVYTVRFAKKGTYRYSCTIHFGMNGKVVVR